MQKWQYLYLYNSGKDYAINGVTYKYKLNENMFDIMDRLGLEGWELVTSPNAYTHTFKRPVEHDDSPTTR